MHYVLRHCDKLERLKSTKKENVKTVRLQFNAFTYQLQDFSEALAEEWNDDSHDRLVVFRHIGKYHPEDPVQGADGDTGKMESDHPFGAGLEFWHFTKSRWYLNPETEDHEEQPQYLIEDAPQGNWISQAENINPDHRTDAPGQTVSEDVADNVADNETFPPHRKTIQVQDEWGIGGIKHG